ncbi:flavin reductase family protein [Flavisphingomonas formosensis]|uniref:flavin reductase family protein n=1 Tax=Flavisphingomonas formosensis TaxID=861534 RepID=UPI0012F96CB5|nr:flavin reductase family protein [Sphingomonas formosensis]
MIFDLEALPRKRRYQLLTATITPRPIAWVTTLSASGVPNAAPFSFFNMMGDDPPIIALGFMPRDNDMLKDTAGNIVVTGEFVVNLVTEEQAEAMNATAAEMPSGQNELERADIATVPSVRVAAPRIAGAPVSFECTALQEIWTSPRQLLVIGKVAVAHIDDRFLIEGARHVDTPALRLVARMHGSNWYARQTDLFQMSRPRSDHDSP